MAITWTKLNDNSWGIRGEGLKAGTTVTVEKRDGTTSSVTVGEVLRTTDGVSVATVARSGAAVVPAKAPPVKTSFASSRGTRTGCRCGSVEEYTKRTDCWSCRHDAE